jgi:hypothetical protein
VVMDKDKVFMAQCFPNLKGARQLNENKYIVEKNYRYYTVDTALQEAVFTLDNAKFRCIKFVYNFMYKCIDMRKVHFTEGDIDGLHFFRFRCILSYFHVLDISTIRSMCMPITPLSTSAFLSAMMLMRVMIVMLVLKPNLIRNIKLK